MELTLSPRPIGGKIAAIASKSAAHRLMICAALSDRATKISCAETSKDVEATARVLTALGADFTYGNGAYTVYPLQLPRGDQVLDCGESGSTLRFLLPVVGALGVSATFRLHGRLAERPLSPLWEAMQAHGCCLSRPSADTVLCEGRLRGGIWEIAGNVSSQFISGLLFALPLTGEASEIVLSTPLESAGYADLTVQALRQFGVEAERTETGWRIPKGQGFRSCGRAAVEGDWSNAAFWLCAGAISAPVTVEGLSLTSAQGDRAILSVLERFGANVETGSGSVTVTPGELHAIELDARHIPDLVPPIALVAACAQGTTRIFGAERLRLKESDRLQSVADALTALGADVTITADGLLIRGGRLCGGRADICNDHRIAMMAAIAACACTQTVTLRGAEAVNKSYPRFWEDYRILTR
ncbi:MAG: 3-phosphoshikimate 1-carboxyvinyltransferase [Oscillospiraceae bacterium]|nr:3-phosphoshikimate 1-carboxyvinyltransferase [Oscillospiraceae bacterium]